MRTLFVCLSAKMVDCTAMPKISGKKYVQCHELLGFV